MIPPHHADMGGYLMLEDDAQARFHMNGGFCLMHILRVLLVNRRMDNTRTMTLLAIWM